MRKTFLAVAAASAIGLSGCASTVPEQTEDNLTNEVADSPEQIVKKKIAEAAANVEKKYLAAKNDNYAYYAPESWSKVNSRIQDMRSQVTDFDPNNQGFFGGPSEDEVTEAISETEESIDAALKIKELTEAFLASPIEDVTYLTPQIQPQWKSAFTRINRELVDLIRDIEDDEDTDGYEDERAEIEAQLLKLEVKIVKNTYYTPLSKQAQQIDQKLVPHSYALVKQDLTKLDAAINFAPRDIQGINTLVAEVKNSLKRATNVTAEVKWIRSIERGQAETIALRYRNALEKISMSLINLDTSSMTYSEQINTLESKVTEKMTKMRMEEDNRSAEQTVLINALKAQLNASLARSQSGFDLSETASIEANESAEETIIE